MTEDEIMLMTIRQCRRVDLVADAKELTVPQRIRYQNMQVRRAQGEPLQYILGHCDFMGIPLSVDERVLIPRPETEILAELAIEKAKLLQPKKMLHVLDLGTGSGNIAIALAKNITNVKITAVDIDAGVLTLAEQNARSNGVEEKIKFCCTDMAEYLCEARDQEKKYDIIISNPPYIPTSQLSRLPDDVRQEPKLALDGGEDGLRFYRTIIHYGHQILNSGNFICMEIGDGQCDDIGAVFKQYPQYLELSFHKDYVGTDRIVCAELKNKRVTMSPVAKCQDDFVIL